MAIKYKHGITRKVIDWIILWLIRLDRAPRHYYSLTVPGRRTGRLYSKPVALVEEGELKWLVAPYGTVNWVVNARATCKVTISRGKYVEEFSISELPVAARAPVLKQYITRFPITRPYFDARPSDPEDRFTPEAQWRPVFELRKSPEGTQDDWTRKKAGPDYRCD